MTTHRCSKKEWLWLRSCIANSDRSELAERFDESHPQRFDSFYESNWKIIFLPPYKIHNVN